MKFYDQVIITVQSGRGGDGLVAARKESGIPMGGPAGGNGGKGGDVIMRGSKDMQTLLNVRKYLKYAAANGEPGRSKDQYGADGEDIVITVPVGTVVRDAASGRALFQFIEDKQEYTLARGGQGGVGNMHFKNAISQYPNFALYGEPGQNRKLLLELQLLADVGLIGTPSVGKSTLINSVSNVKAKTAAYHFTTLSPNLGSIDVDGFGFNMIDIPGLIQGASAGKGLGNAFLRHVLKAQIFALVVDAHGYEKAIEDMLAIVQEVFIYMEERFENSEEFGSAIHDVRIVPVYTENKAIMLRVLATEKQEEERVLFEKLIHIVLNKIDLINDQEIYDELAQASADRIATMLNTLSHTGTSSSTTHTFTSQDILPHVFPLSAATKEGTEQRLHYLSDTLQTQKVTHMSLWDTQELSEQEQIRIQEATESKKQWLIDNQYIEKNVSKYAKVWRIYDHDFARLVYMTPWGNEEAQMRFWKVVGKEQFIKLFEKNGVLPGDVLWVVSPYAGTPDRYVMYGV